MLARDRREGVPLVHAVCDFYHASQIGDVVAFELVVTHIGAKSFTVSIVGSHEDETRLRAELVLAYVKTAGKMTAIPLPAELRAKMEHYRDAGTRQEDG